MTAAGAARTLGAVLGLGALLLPAALAPVPAPWAGAALAGVLAGWCLLVAAAGGTAGAGPVAFVRDRLGSGPARAVTALYFAGFATGQGAVALAAAGFATGDPGRPAFPVAVAVLVTAAGFAAYRPRSLSPRAGRIRLGAVLALAAAWWLLGGPEPASPPAADWPVALVAVPLLFGWVGLESAVPALRRRTGSPGAGPGATLLGLALAAGLYGVLLRPAGWLAAPHPAVTAALGLVSAAVCWTYCRTNLQATAARWAELTEGSRRTGAAAGTLIALGALGVGHLAHWGTAVLLIGPGTATAAIYLFIAVAALRRPRSEPLPKETLHDHRHRDLEGAARRSG